MLWLDLIRCSPSESSFAVDHYLLESRLGEALGRYFSLFHQVSRRAECQSHLHGHHFVSDNVESYNAWPVRSLAEVTLNRVLNHLAQFFQRVSLGKDIVTQSPRSKTSVGLVFTYFEDDF